jgi:general secretion pathway protein C
MQSHWRQKLTAFLLWGLAAGCAVFWALKFAAAPTAVVPLSGAGAPPAVRVDTAQVAQLLGAKATNAVANNDGGALTLPKIPTKYVLTGLIAAGRASVALIAFDGKSARAYRVGAKVDEGLVLQSVDKKSANLGPTAKAPATLTLELPTKPGPVVVSAYTPASPPAQAAPPIIVPPSISNIMGGALPTMQGGLNAIGVAAAPLNQAPNQPLSQPLTEQGTVQNAATDPSQGLPRANRLRGLPGAPPPPAADGAAPAEQARN